MSQLTQMFADLKLSAPQFVQNQIEGDIQSTMYAKYSSGGLLLFLRKIDLENTNSEYVYFTVYSTYPKIQVYWGVYDKMTGDFIFDHGCEGRLTDLDTIITTWKSHGYEYASNIVEDKIRTTMNRYTSMGSRMLNGNRQAVKTRHVGNLLIARKLQLDYNKYATFKKYYEDKTLLDEDIETIRMTIAKNILNNPALDLNDPLIDRTLEKHKDDIILALEVYEETINRIDVSRDFDRTMKAEISKITNNFFEVIKTGKYFYFDRPNEQCPSKNECSRSNSKLCNLYEYGHNVSYEGDLL